MTSGTPGPTRRASHRIARGLRRTQPRETAVPSAPGMPVVPCSAIWPPPPPNSWETGERALAASAYGAPVLRNATLSSMKPWPTGVGVAERPTTARKRPSTRPLRATVTRRFDSRTVTCHGVDVRRVRSAEIQPACPLGRPGRRAWDPAAPAGGGGGARDGGGGWGGGGGGGGAAARG